MSETISSGLVFSPESQREDWKRKLVSLQTQHRKESLEQQREHLAQLHLLQDQLLQEISFNMSATGTSDCLHVSQPQALGPGVELEDGTTTGAGGVVSQPITTPPRPALPLALQLSHASGPVATPTEPPPCQPLSVESSPVHSRGPVVSPHPPHTPTPERKVKSVRIAEQTGHADDVAGVAPPSGVGVSPACHTPSPSPLATMDLLPSRLPLPQRDRGRADHTPSPSSITGSSPLQAQRDGGHVNHTPSPSPLAVMGPSPSRFSQAQRDGGHVSHTPSPSPLAVVGPSPSRFPQAQHDGGRAGHTPSPASTPGGAKGMSPHPQISHTPSPSSHSHVHFITDTSPSIRAPLPSTHPRAIAHPYGSCPHTPSHVITGEAPLLSSSCGPPLSRPTLLEKHAKHIADLKDYYESEISVLSERLAKLDGERRQAENTTPTRRSLNFDVVEGTPIGQETELWGGERGGALNKPSDVAKLEAECLRWKKMFHETRRSVSSVALSQLC